MYIVGESSMHGKLVISQAINDILCFVFFDFRFSEFN